MKPIALAEIEPYLKRFTVRNHKLRYGGEYPTDAREALVISLAKWTRLARQRGKDVLLDGDSQTCGLCMLYYRNGPCNDCPIRALTDRTDCIGTPYWAYREADTPAKAREASKRELHLLQSLSVP